MKEHVIEEAILEYLNINGWFAWKNHTTGYYDQRKNTWRRQGSRFAINGVSDIIAVKDGSVLFIEVKTPRGRQTQQQRNFEKRLTENGGIYLLVRSLHDIKKFLASLRSR